MRLSSLPGLFGQCGSTLPDRTAERAPVMMNLKLHHKQMHYQQSPFLNNFKVKTTTNAITNMLAGHDKLMLYSLKAFLVWVNLVGLSL